MKPALWILSSVNMLMSPDANAAPSSAFFHGTPTMSIGMPIGSIRPIVQPNSLRPDPFFFSSTSATVL
jgi:hypothetical protein